MDLPDAKSAESVESTTIQSTLAEDNETCGISRSSENDNSVSAAAADLFYDDKFINSMDDSFLSSSNLNYSDLEEFPLESMFNPENTKEDNLSEVGTLREALSVVYYQYLSMKLKLRGVCDNLKSHVSECEAVQSAVRDLESILDSPSVLPNVIFPETSIDFSPLSKADDVPSSPPPSMEPLASVPIESPSSSISSVKEAVDDLERAVIYNGTLVDSLKDLQLFSSSLEEDLRQRLQILYTNNMLLTSIIDSNNTHTFEMSSLLSQKSGELLSLKDELTETRSELTSLSAQFSKSTEEEEQSQRRIAWLEELTSSLQLEVDTSSKQREDDAQKRIQALTETNRSLQQEIRRLRAGVLISTAAGEFNSANPTAIIACIQGLTSRVALAEAKVETAERRYRVNKLNGEEKNIGQLRNELQLAQRCISEKENLLREYKARLGKMKQNEVSYKKIVSELRVRLQQRQSELKEIYAFLQG